MRNLFSNGLAIFAGVVSLPVAGSHADAAKPATNKHRNESIKDPRLAFLRTFFERGNCPAAKLSSTFLEAADTNALDWRLLPSLSFIESTGGKAAKNNNMFGWDSGRAVFSSAAAGIRAVASYLSHSALYRNKNVDGILRTYNTDAGYGRKVKAVMSQIAPEGD
jgi:hypothetical protein